MSKLKKNYKRLLKLLLLSVLVITLFKYNTDTSVLILQQKVSDDKKAESEGVTPTQPAVSPSRAGDVTGDPEVLLFQSTSPLTSVGIWVDLPNAFPWRFCLQEYNGLLAPLNCDSSLASQLFSLESVNKSQQFQWKTSQGHCVVPGLVVHEGQLKDSLTVDPDCGEPGSWTWTKSGQFRWSEGCQHCVQTFKVNTPVEVVVCRDQARVLHSYWSKANEARLSLVESFRVLLAQTILCHKEQARRIQSWFFMA